MSPPIPLLVDKGMQGSCSTTVGGPSLVHDNLGATLHSVDDTALYGYNPFMARLLQARHRGAIDDSPFTALGALFWPLDLY